MSDILASSSIDARMSSPLPTAATESSDGPTLPIIGAANGVSGKEHGATKGTKRTKRKRASNDTPKPDKAVAAMKNDNEERTHTNHPALYEPWTLLPPKQRRDIEARQEKGMATVVTVYSKNQNVKSGISRLLRVVGAANAVSTAKADLGGGAEDETDTEVGKRLKEAQGVDDENKMIVVSAQGEGTVKLVGIVDMVRRIVGDGTKGSGKEEGMKWHLYTVLSSVEMTRTRKTLGEVKGQDQGDGEDNDVEDEAMDVDEEGGAVKETQRSKKEETRKVPVLSVWMTRERMAGWKEAFGEQEMTVCKAAD
ncbi:hypothetical protein E8E11_002779 [Didymella keratinophila]|nr:hypothetical protein E8E11_002779 [Didymella keratinophila]